jgi:hypothetical protein
VRIEHAARHRHQKRPGEVRGGVGEDAGGVGDGEPELGRGGQVDVVEANRVVGYAQEVGVRFQHLAVDALGEQREQNVGAARALDQRVALDPAFVVVLRDDHIHARLSENRDACLGDPAGDEDAPRHPTGHDL